jgi:hypothetical protein
MSTRNNNLRSLCGCRGTCLPTPNSQFLNDGRTSMRIALVYVTLAAATLACIVWIARAFDEEG